MNLIRRSLFSLLVSFAMSGVLRAQTTTTTTPTTPTVSTTGVLIYEVKFEHLAGFNIDFWDGGWVVLPGVGSNGAGGTGTVVLTGKSNFGTRIYRQFASTVYSFVAKRHKGKSMVIQMTGGALGTQNPLVSIQAFGDIEGTIALDNPTFTLKVEAAKKLRGLATASLDESLIPATITSSTGSGTTAASTTTVNPARPTDGTLGYVEFAETTLTYDSGKTEKANKKGLSLTDAVTNEVINALKAKGYTDGSSTSSGSGSGGTGSGGTGSGGTGSGGTGTNP